MIEIRRIKDYSSWTSPLSCLIPTKNITPADQKAIDKRDQALDRIKQALKEKTFWVKINTGIYRGTILEVGPHDQTIVNFGYNDDVKSRWQGTRTSVSNLSRGLDQSKGWDFADREANLSIHFGNKPIKFKEGIIFPEFFGIDISNNASVLLDYQGGPVFSLNEKLRPLTFTDRLDQDVGIGDLVVVALNYGAGLDICMVRGYADAKRVVIESVEDGTMDRIPLEDNSTAKIMKMPNSLQTTAMLMKLARN